MLPIVLVCLVYHSFDVSILGRITLFHLFTFLYMRPYIGSVAIGFFLRPAHLHMKFTHVSTNDHLVVSEILTKNVLMSV